MPPESAGNLVLVEIELKNSKRVCRVYRIDPINLDQANSFDVSFAARDRPPGFESVAGGVVYVRRAGSTLQTYDANLPKRGDGAYWRHPVHRNGLFAAVVLPQGYSLPSVDEATPLLTEVKLHSDGRLVLHWDIADNRDHSAEFTWHMATHHFDQSRLEQHCSELNNEAFQRRQGVSQVSSHSPSATPSAKFPSWAPIAGAIFGGVTLVFFMALVVAGVMGYQIAQGSTFALNAILALGVALAAAFLGGDAAAKGNLPIPLLQDRPVEFAIGGGLAAFVIIFLIANALNPSPPGVPSPPAAQAKETFTVCHGEYEKACKKHAYTVWEECSDKNGVEGFSPTVSCKNLCKKPLGPGLCVVNRAPGTEAESGDHCGYSWLTVSCF
jgi:hypothetical protein